MECLGGTRIKGFVEEDERKEFCRLEVYIKAGKCVALAIKK